MDRHTGSSFGREYSGEIAEMGEQLWYRLAARVSAGRGKWEARFARGIRVTRDSEGQNSAKEARGISLECKDAPRHSGHTLETHAREICTSCWTKHVHHGEDDRCSWTDGQLQKVLYRAGESFSRMSTWV